MIMQPVDGLAEGLSKDQLIEQFERVDSDAYLQEVAKIKARLANVPLYQLEDN